MANNLMVLPRAARGNNIDPLPPQERPTTAPIGQDLTKLFEDVFTQAVGDALASIGLGTRGDDASRGATAAASASGVDPSSFSNGGVYKQVFNPSTGKYSYAQVDPKQVPRGAIVYVNGFNTDGPGLARYGQEVSKQNDHRDVYCVFNDTPWWDVGEVANANNNPGGDHSPSINSVRTILENNRGGVTLMGHSMGSEVIADAAYQYHQEGGALDQTYLYGWGGSANAGNVEQIDKWGAHYENFVHEEIDQVDSSGNSKVVQPGDQVAGWESGPAGGNNWASETEDAQGNITGYQTNDPTTIGIDYWGGAAPGNNGHDYTGQIGNTLGGVVTTEDTSVDE